MTQNREEFTAWWVHVEPYLLRRARRYGISSEAARDLIQDVAILALKSRQEFTDEDHFRKWAFSRFHWLILDELRRQKRFFHPIEEVEEKSVLPSQEQKLMVEEILQVVDQLPKHQRAVLMGLLEGQPTSNTAKALGVTEATVRSLQRYARRNLVTLLAEKDTLA